MLDFPVRGFELKTCKIRRLTACRFKGEKTYAVKFSSGVNLCVGGVGCGKTLLFDAIWVLSMIARGADATVARYGWWSVSLPTEIEIEVESEQVGVVVYSFKVHQDGLFSVVDEERLVHEGKLMLHRSMGQFSQVGAGVFKISNTRFALSSVIPKTMGDPVGGLRNFLSNIWLLSPNPTVMVDGLQSNVQLIDVECRYLAHHIVERQREQPQLYGLLMQYLVSFGVDPVILLILNDNFGQPYLAVRKPNAGYRNTMPFGCLSFSEKLLVLVAFVRATNELMPSVCCVWDNPLNSFGDRECTMILQTLVRTFETQGQAILLSQYRSVVEGLGNLNRIEVRYD